MATVPQVRPDDDSEDDEDYVPSPEDSSDSDSDSELHKREVKKRRISASPVAITNEEQEAARRALWSEFTASGSTINPTQNQESTKMITIEVRCKFAGEEVLQKKEVPEDSVEARQYLKLHRTQQHSQEDSAADQPVSQQQSSNTTDEIEPSPSTAIQAVPLAREKSPAAPTVKALPKRTARKSLASMAAGGKPKKLTTLEMSKMDWNSHLASSSEEQRDEIERNRRGGGYLEKVDFLERVGERKEDVLEARKRRR